MKKIIVFFALLVLSLNLQAKTIKDQLGRIVEIPKNVSRAVVLQHQTLDIAIQLNVINQIVGVLESWEKTLGKNYVRLAPQLKDMPMPGDLKSVNIEALLKLKPDIVIVTHYFPQEYIAQMEKLHIPVIAISLFKAKEDEVKKLNPTLQDEAYSFDNGLKEAINIIGSIFEKEKNASELIDYMDKSQAILSSHIKEIVLDDKIKTYMANPKLHTYGTGKYTGFMMKRAGAINVAKDIKGYKQVSMEQIIAWNPEVIFIQSRYPEVIDEINNSKQWALVNAVKNKRVYLMPEYAKAWGHPLPESMALGELWMAKKLYPNEFKSVDVEKMADEYYEKFYRVKYLID